ncbi:MAG: dockerin type I repeat-containing protein [Clostridiales bacterium]|nr:dockerin type I repeat-containing protein [Clostridiales bacterium]
MRKHAKILLSLLLVLCLLLSLTANTAVAAGYSYKNGDTNGSGDLSAEDAALVLRHLAGVSPLTGAALAAADADLSGSVNAGDAAAILRHLAGLSTLPGWGEEEPVVLNLLAPAELTLAANGMRLCKFTAPGWAVFKFYSSHPGGCNPLALDTNFELIDDDSGDGLNYSFEVFLADGQTYYFYSAVSGGDAWNTYYVTVTCDFIVWGQP